MLSQNSCSFMHDQKKLKIPLLHRLQHCGVIVYFHVSGNKKNQLGFFIQILSII